MAHHFHDLLRRLAEHSLELLERLNRVPFTFGVINSTVSEVGGNDKGPAVEPVE
jgi:hypothetical protein